MVKLRHATMAIPMGNQTQVSLPGFKSCRLRVVVVVGFEVDRDGEFAVEELKIV